MGRGLLFGIPALFLIGLLILPLDLPGVLALTIVVIGAAAVVALAERARSISRGEAGRARRSMRELSGTAYLMIVGALLLTSVYVLFLIAVAGRN